MNHDYHIHTKYCKHSDLVVDEIIKEYIKNKFIEVGISDHIPYPGKMDAQDGSRMNMNELKLYLNDMDQAKKTYGQQIKIWTGFESEYFPSMHGWYKELLCKENVDYLILGIHAVENLEPENNYNKNCTNKRELQRYWKSLEAGMKTGLFLYAVHPDFYMKSYEIWDEDCAILANKICDLALKLDFPLGFNINGFWKGARKIGNVIRRKYPIQEFWEIVKAKKVKVILESDVHHKKQLYDKEIINKTIQLLKEWEIDHLLVNKVDVLKYKNELKI